MTHGSWNDCYPPFTYSYQWYWSTSAPPNGTTTAISGATSSTFTPNGYVGDYLTVTVTACDLNGVCSVPSVRAQDGAGNPGYVFVAANPSLGASNGSPMWSHGPLSVNEANGNLVVSLPTPSYPTASDALTFSLTYNSQAPSGANSPGLGKGWTLAAGDSSTSSPLEVTPTTSGAEVAWPDGSTEFYNPVGSSGTYAGNPGDGTQLSKNSDGSGWTLLGGDGTSYVFDTASGSNWLLTSASTPATPSGAGVLTYAFDTTPHITSITYQQTSGDSNSESLNFTWASNCYTGVTTLFCVQFKQNGSAVSGQEWAYTADANNEITGVYDPARHLYKVTYDGTSGLPTKFQNADDLDPTHAGSNYNPNHSVIVSYDSASPARVACVIDGPLTGQAATTQPSCAGGVPASQSTWLFEYHPGTIEPTPPRASHYGYLVRNDGPAAYYPLDETSGTTATDASGNGNNATYQGSVTLGQSAALAGSGAGSSVSFGGGTIAATNVSNLDLSSGGVNTVEFWLNWKGVTGEMPLAFDNAGAAYDLYLGSGCFGFNTGNSDVYGVPIPSGFANAWHYVVAEFYNGNPEDGAKLWIDGVPQTMSCIVGTPVSRTISSTFNVSGWPGGTGYRLGGGDSVDEVAVYGYPLLPSQITAHYAEALHDPAPAAYYRLDEASGTSAADSSGNGNTATYSGSYTSVANGAYPGSGRAITFSGGTLSGSVPNVNTSGGGYNTVEFWMNWDGTNNEMPFGFGYSGGPAYDLYFSNGYFGFNTGCSDLYGISSTGLAGGWHDVVAEFYNGLPQNGAKLWIDGVQKTLSVQTGTPCSDSAAPGFNISGWPAGSGYRLTGSIDEVALYNGALTPAEVAAHYYTNATQGLRVGGAAGYTTVKPPNQQGQACPPNCVTTYYDSLNHPAETIDTLGHISESHYNNADSLLWSEDEAGNPTDYLYGSPTGKPTGNSYLAEPLLETIGPDPDGSGPMVRPVAINRYDEQTIGTASQAGNPLAGLSGSYWTNLNLAGPRAARENDPAPGSSATTFSLPASGMTWPPSAVGTSTSAFSARWTGVISVPSAGDYTFTTAATPSNSGTRLTVDGADTLENWVNPTSPFNSQSVHLSAGPHPLVLAYEHPSGTSASLTLEWSCSDCTPAITTTAVPLTDLAPAWENQTSTVTPAGRISFQHYANPSLPAEPDYSLSRLADGTNLITSYAYNDPLGRMTTMFMPKANSGATLNSTTGALSSTPDTHYETDYHYYSDGATAAPPAACGGSAVNQYGQLQSTIQHTSGQTGGVHSIVTVYNAEGLPAAITNGQGDSCLTYDAENRLTSQTPAGDQAHPTSYTYYPDGSQHTAQNNNGTVTDIYDEAGRLVDTVDASGAEAHFCYDADSNLTTRAANTTSLGSTTCPLTGNYTTSYTYNSADQLTSETDPVTNTYHFYYDERGNLRGTQYPTTTPTFSWVDTNPDGWISDQYNRHGTISAGTTTPPSDSSPLADSTYTYDQDGKRLSEVRKSGATSQTTTYSYDNAGRLSQLLLPSGTCRDYSYDLDSNRAQIQESTTGCSGTFSTTDSYTYDPNTTPGIDQLTSRNAGGTTYTYTSDGQLTSVLDANTTSYSWDGWDRLTNANIGGSSSSTNITYTYDPTGSLKQRSWSLGPPLNPASPSRGSTSGSRSGSTPSTTPSSTPSTTPRLTPSTTPGTTPSTTPGPTTSTTPRSTSTTTPTSTTSTTPGSPPTSTALGLSSSTPPTSTSSTTSGWRPVTTSGRASRKTSAITSGSTSGTINYLLGDLFETNSSNTITTSYTDGPAGALTSYNGPPTSTSTATFLYYDAHGNLAAEANSSGTLTANHTYDPFGSPLDGAPDNTTVHRFVGRWNKQYDTGAGLVLMGARPYDPNTGRFLAIDPIPGGSLNNYDYAGQDPISGYDLNGTCYNNKAAYKMSNWIVVGSRAELCRDVQYFASACIANHHGVVGDCYTKAAHEACGRMSGTPKACLATIWRPERLKSGAIVVGRDCVATVIGGLSSVAGFFIPGPGWALAIPGVGASGYEAYRTC